MKNKERATSRLFAGIDKGVSILRIISKLKKVVSFFGERMLFLVKRGRFERKINENVHQGWRL